MKSYCVKEKKQTECVPGSEIIKVASNGRNMITCRCASCGITKTQFISGQTGGAVAKDYACGINLKGKRPGTVEECFKSGQIRRYGQMIAEDLDDLLLDQKIDRQRATKRRYTMKKNQQNQKIWAREAKTVDRLDKKDRDRFTDIAKKWLSQTERPAPAAKSKKRRKQGN